MPRVKRNCLHCSKIFDHYASNGPGKFCSYSCHARHRGTRHLKKYQFKKGKPSFNKNKKTSDEVKEKISKSLKEFYARGGKTWNKGLTDKDNPIIGVSAAKAREAKKDKPAWNKGLTKKTDERVAKYAHKLKGMKKPWQEGAKHHQWKGKGVTYTALHKWIARRLGSPDTCEHCNISGLSSHQIHWANKSGKYKRDLDDWVRLCVKCHYLFDQGK